MAAVTGAMVSAGTAACSSVGRSRAAAVALSSASGRARGRARYPYADRRYVSVIIAGTRHVSVVLPPEGSMTPSRTYNVVDYTAGDTLIVEYTIKASTGAATNLTSATFRYSVAPLTRGVLGSALFTKQIGDGIEIVSASDGVVRVTIDEGEIPTAGIYWHELECLLGSGASYTCARGRIVADPALLPTA